MGSVATEAARAVATLENSYGIRCTLLVVASLNPPPIEDLTECLSRFPVALTIEAHYRVGGLGSLVSEVVAEQGIRCRIVRCGVGTTPDGVSGSQAYLRDLHSLSGEKLVEVATLALDGVKQ